MDHLEEEVSLRGFLRYTEHEFKLSSEVQRLKDGRQSPRIPTSMVAQTMAVGAALGMTSLRQTDGMTRQPSVRAALGTGRGQISDTEISRVVGMQQSDLAECVMSAVWRRARGNGLCGIALGCGRRHVGVIDGSEMGGRLTSVLVEAGDVPGFIGMSRIPKRGKELPISFKLIGETAQREGKGFVDILLGDSLYACKGFWKACKEAGVFGVVKTEEEDLSIIQRAKRAIKHGLLDVGYEEGVDLKRGCRYRIWVGPISWGGHSWEDEGEGPMLKVAKVWECILEGPHKDETEVFWVLSQDLSLDAWSMRELGHQRWFVENNGFRALNEQAHSKHRFSRRSRPALVFSMLQAVGMMLIAAYRCYLGRFRKRLRSLWDHGALSLKLLRLCMAMSLGPTVWADTG